ncbi:pentapeptide repeat-containing protein [Microcoleus sp. MOSTC5]|uniref:pentapeptide repeat-containing protein n=1 Tax=Microcoleus sp. MOSTC5 TaxID=3055378 RepID=UPI002FD308E6
MEKQEFLDLLKQGVDSWNFWRQKNLDVEVDISYIRFRRDFSGIDFSGVNLSGSDFSEVDISRANFNGANLSGANLSEAQLIEADLTDANLSKANLSEADLTDANLSKANLVGANLKEAHLANANFRDADLSGANLSEAYLLGTDLGEANLSKANLKSAEVIEANLSGANLSGAYLNGANLSGTDFSRANLRKAHLEYNGYDFQGINTNLIESNLSGANLSGANLSGANLNGTEFYGANLTKANLSHTQAVNAQFAFAKFTGVCIEGWQCNKANFNGVICEFVYLDSNRRKPYPVARRFTPGEFTKVFQKNFKTIDIVICDAIDYEAFVYSFKALQAKHEDVQLDIQSIDEKGEDIYVIKVGMSPDVDRKETHAEFMQIHELISESLEEKYRTEISVKETQIVQYQQETQTLRENINNLHNILQQQTEVQKLMAETPKYDLRGSKFGGGFAGDGGTQIGGILNDYSSKQSLDEAAAEISQLLKQLEETNPTTTETEKMIIAAKAADEIKNNPTLKARVIGAFKSGGTEAFKEAVDNPLVNVLVAIIEGWMQAD